MAERNKPGHVQTQFVSFGFAALEFVSNFVLRTSCVDYDITGITGCCLRSAHGHPIVATAEVLIRAVIDVLPNELHGAVHAGEVCAVGMVRLEAPGHGPVHDAAGLI